MSATIPREEEYCRRTNWFSRLFWQSKCEDQNSYSNRDIEKYNDTQWTSGDNMSSKIQYKISKPIIPQHILTPKKTVKNPYAWSGKNISLDPKVNEMEEEKVVDAFLYTKPPNIVHIESSMPSYNDLPSQKTVSSKKTALKTSEKWSYESPLSRWFLRGSTYFKDYGLSKTSLKTPTGAPQLKQMKMLSRDEPTPEEREKLHTFIGLYAELYPCGECSYHFVKLIEKYPVQTSSRTAAAMWGCHIHNKVNEYLKKDIYDCATILEDYDCGCSDSDGKRVSLEKEAKQHGWTKKDYINQL